MTYRTGSTETRVRSSEVKQMNSDWTHQEGGKLQDKGDERRFARSTQLVSGVSSVRQLTKVEEQSGTMEDDHEDDDVGQLSIDDIRVQHEELLQGRVQGEANYAEMTRSDEMEEKTRKRFEEGRGIRQAELTETDEEPAEEQHEEEVIDDTPVNNTDAREERRERIENEYWLNLAVIYSHAAAAEWNPLREYRIGCRSKNAKKRKSYANLLKTTTTPMRRPKEHDTLERSSQSRFFQSCRIHWR